MRPSWLWFLLLDGGIVILTKLAFSKSAYEKVGEKAGDALRRARVLQAMLVGTAVIHGAEALVAGRMARRRGLPVARLAAADLRRRFPLPAGAAPEYPRGLNRPRPRVRERESLA